MIRKITYIISRAHQEAQSSKNWQDKKLKAVRQIIMITDAEAKIDEKKINDELLNAQLISVLIPSERQSGYAQRSIVSLSVVPSHVFEIENMDNAELSRIVKVTSKIK
ncbi:MAG: hypothetical protein KGH64_03000 [Candidatus Micrarchaeota archaeon]|nr:hypothetical protein [Candidatus Micrarchaeota archaeon]MDE1859421.1 hypothetical protein [Candidatus Micrarchaeota archaeon]